MRRWQEFDEQLGRGIAPLYYTTGDIILREEMEPYLERTTSQWGSLFCG